MTTAGATLDYLVGRLTNKLSAGILAWALLTLFAAASLDFAKDVWAEHHGHGNAVWTTTGGGLISAAGIIRGRLDHFRWATVINAFAAAALAGIACYAFSVAVITFRFLTVPGGPLLGGRSPYDQSAIAFISAFQASSTIAWFVVACFAIALILRPPVVLPLGVIAVSVANAIVLALPHLSRSDVPFRDQVASTLAAPDSWLLSLPSKSVLLGCAISFFIGIVACGAISRRVSQ